MEQERVCFFPEQPLYTILNTGFAWAEQPKGRTPAGGSDRQNIMQRNDIQKATHQQF